MRDWGGVIGRGAKREREWAGVDWKPDTVGVFGCLLDGYQGLGKADAILLGANVKRGAAIVVGGSTRNRPSEVGQRSMHSRKGY